MGSKNYKDMAFTEMGQYVREHSLRLTPAQETLREFTKDFRGNRMLSSPEQMQLCANMCKMIGAKKTLDIGVYTGYSSLSIALALPSDGKVIACDVNEDFVSKAKPYWKKAGVDTIIDLRIAPATETLQKLLDNGEAGTFDFAFIDADKMNYDNYYEMGLKLLRKGGFLAIDNVFWGGSVANPEDTSPDTIALKQLNDKIYKDERICVSMLPIGDGTTFVFKVKDF